MAELELGQHCGVADCRQLGKGERGGSPRESRRQGPASRGVDAGPGAVLRGPGAVLRRP